VMGMLRVTSYITVDALDVRSDESPIAQR